MRQSSLLAVLALSASLSGAALAQAPETTVGPTVASLQSALDVAKAAGAEQAAEAARLADLIDGCATMVDKRRAPEERVTAVATVGKASDARTLPLLWVTSSSSSPEVRRAVVKAVASWDHPEARVILGDRAASRGEGAELRTAAIEALAASGEVQAAEILYKISLNEQQTPEVRKQVLATLDKHFADFMKTKVRPKRAADPGGLKIAAAGNALAGGVLLGSVGIWGQGDEGPVIGMFGGAAIGAGTAYLYAKDRPITPGEGLAYTSNVTWGLTAGLMSSYALDVDSDEAVAALSSLGVGIGVYTGLGRMESEPSKSDVIKSNIAGFMGTQIGRSGMGLTQVGGRQTEHDGTRLRTLAAIAGGAAGLGLSHAFRDDWQPSHADALFSGVVGIESAIAMGLLPVALDGPTGDGQFIDFGLFAGTTGGMIAAHHMDVQLEQAMLMGYGTGTGNLFGLGLSMLPAEPLSESTMAGIVLPVGIAGTVVGAWSHKHLDPTEGDWTMVSVGTGLSAAQLSAMSFVALEEGLIAEEQAPGIILTGTTLASAGFMAATKNVELEPIDSLFMGSAAGWGTLYGSIGQLALGLDMESDSRAVAVTTISADIGLGLGGYILSDKTQMEPMDTLIPQIGGVAGATLGSLTVLLSTSEGQPVAIGSLAGATLGLGVGTLIAPHIDLGDRDLSMAWIPKPNIDLPGDWSFSATPAATQDGKMGAALSLRARGL